MSAFFDFVFISYKSEILIRFRQSADHLNISRSHVTSAGHLVDQLSLQGASGVAGPSFPQGPATSSGVATITVNPSASIGGASVISQSAPSSPTAGNVTLPDGQKIIGERALTIYCLCVSGNTILIFTPFQIS